jgi:hypothetical protein
MIDELKRTFLQSTLPDHRLCLILSFPSVGLKPVSAETTTEMNY